MSEEHTEQITKVPTEWEAQVPKKEKDPNKVAAGKKLADYNKKLKAAYEREKKLKLKMLTNLLEGGLYNRLL